MAARPEVTGRATLADDLLEGVGRIAKFMGIKPRRVFYLAEAGSCLCSKWAIGGAVAKAH
jgi:hypothetical protein